MATKRKPRKHVNSGLNITVHTMNGGPLPDDVRDQVEAAVQNIVTSYEGERLLLQVVRG
jgi:hypothetical protein